MTTPNQHDADLLAAQCHALIRMLHKKRPNPKLLRAALDSLQLIGGYKTDRPHLGDRTPAPNATAGDVLRM